MKLDPYSLAMLPLGHLTDGVDPFDRYCQRDCVLGEPYRTVVNLGVRAYQLHTYLGLVEHRFGVQTRCLVQEHQRGALHYDAATGRAIKNTLGLIVQALGTQAVHLSSDWGDLEAPIEMNIALLLLLNVPQSPDFVTDPDQRMEQISLIGMDVDWCFAQCLIRGREAIAEVFTPMFAGTVFPAGARSFSVRSMGHTTAAGRCAPPSGRK